MNEKFDPAPYDKYATSNDERRNADSKTTILDAAIMETFPASDPVSLAQPGPAANVADEGTPGTGEAICPKCQGNGKIENRPCDNCKGSGKIVQGIGGG
jgi:hypothetical protein